MIKVKLMGRLGNQMFQIAAALAYGQRYNMPVCVPRQTEDPAKWPQVYFPDLPSAGTGNTMFPYRDYGRGYVPIPFYQNIVIEGYFISEAYFRDQLPFIRKRLGFEAPTRHGVVAIHVRRGDYLKEPDHYQVATLSYLRNAVYHFQDMGYRTFQVYSDDIMWCRRHLNERYFMGTEFLFSGERRELDDLRSLSACEHQIISNSTFSMMGAIMNGNPNKIVVAPSFESWWGPKNNAPARGEFMPQGWVTYPF